MMFLFVVAKAQANRSTNSASEVAALWYRAVSLRGFAARSWTLGDNHNLDVQWRKRRHRYVQIDTNTNSRNFRRGMRWD